MYGEIRGGHYHPLWDSPLLSDWGSLGWDYKDLDGDGVKEVLVWSSRNPYYRSLVAFDIAGHQLIRETNCVGDGLQGYDETNSACPILGEDIELDEPVNGRIDILALSRSDTSPRRYRLIDGTYRLVK